MAMLLRALTVIRNERRARGDGVVVKRGDGETVTSDSHTENMTWVPRQVPSGQRKRNAERTQMMTLLRAAETRRAR